LFYQADETPVKFIHFKMEKSLRTEMPPTNGHHSNGDILTKRYDALSRIDRQIIVLCDPAGGWIEGHQDWADFSGQRDSSGYEWIKALHPEDVAPTLSLWRKSITVPRNFELTCRVLRKDGVYCSFLIHSTPIVTPEGNVLEWLCVHRDVTDSQQAQAKSSNALRELNDLKSAIDEHAIVAITDPKGKITYVNDKFCAISKYPREELLGQDHRLINSGFHPKQFIRTIWHTINSGRVWKGEIKNKAKDGTFYWVDTTIVPYLDAEGKPFQFIAIRADISERKRAEELTESALRELNDVKSAIDEHAIVAITNAQGKITYVNDRFCAISKYSREELLGKDHRLINSGFHPKEFIRSIWQTIGSGRVWRGEIKNRAKDGNFYWVDTTIVPYLGEDGKPVQYIAIRADITDRKMAAEQTARALRELNDLKAALDEHAIVAITDPKGKITYVNDKFCAISRYPREELLGRDHRLINSGFHPKEFIRSIWQTISSGRVWKGEIKNKAKDGTFYWVDTTIVPYLGEDGKPLQYIAIRADITDRKRADEQTGTALRELNDVKAAIDEHAIVAITDRKGKITYVNDKFCAISKYPREELLGQDHRLINSGFHPKQFIRSIWETINSGRVWKGEIKNKAKDGTFYWVDTTIVPYLGEDGKPVQYIAIRADITDRKRADEQTFEALRELNDVKAALDEHAIVAITDSKGKITYVNDKFCAISKYSREELLGQDHRIINSGYHPKQFIRNIWQTISAGRVWKGEIKNKAKDGTNYWVDTTIVPYLSEDGKPIQYIAIRADITERKAAEGALQRARNDLQEHATTLEQTVNARTSTLRETIGELEAFSYSISHDMRAPLRAMQSFSQILAEECEGQVSPTGQEYIRRIRSSAERMDGLIQDVLTYSRVARTDLPLKPVNVGLLLRDIVDSYPIFQSPNADIELKDEFPTVFAIPAVLTQCISNVLGNAVKFVKPGVLPRVLVWAEDGGEAHGGEAHGGEEYVKIFFKDNGVGIDKEAHETIFGIFQRVSKNYEGSGIGLAIVKKGVERMNGHVGLVSQPGEGSTFWLQMRKYKTLN
jgi:PAS domain S-box-containing protein